MIHGVSLSDRVTTKSRSKRLILTTGVVAGSQKDTTSSLPLADDMAGSWRRQDTVLADEELLDAVCGTNLGNQLDHLGVIETTVATNDEERAYLIM